jgi:methanogenic corrinoid protein MtbC1
MVGFPSILDSAFKSWIKHDPIPPKGFLKSRSSPKITAKAPPTAQNPNHAADLARMVEAEIIPRLMLAHRQVSDTPEATVGDTRLGPEETESFARMVLSANSDSLIAYVGGLLQSGLPMETIYVDLMMPAARLLGDYWDEDSISFADVTIGLGRLQQVVRTLRSKSTDLDGSDHSAPSALFAPVSSEQHTFGLFIIEESFRRAGWRTWIETSGVQEDAIDMVRSHWFDLIGFSANSDAQIEEVASTIAAVRKASRNRGLFVLVGGRLFIDSPELVSAVGADATAPNGGEALLVADKAVRRLSHNA